MTQSESIVTPLAILFVTSSSQGNNIPFRWPPNPTRPTRLAAKKDRNKPSMKNVASVAGFGSWEADRSGDETSDSDNGNDPEFTAADAGGRSTPTPTSSSRHHLTHKHSDPSPTSHPPSGRPSSTKTATTSPAPSPSLSVKPLPSSSAFLSAPLPSASDFNQIDYDFYFESKTTFWANILSPSEDLCQQRFELVADDMCFVGHPMRGGGPNGLWTFGDEGEVPSSAGGPAAGSGSIIGNETGRGRRQGPRVTPGQAMGLEGLSLSSSSPSSSHGPPITGLPPTSLEDVLEGSPPASQNGSSSTTTPAEPVRPKPVAKNSSFDTPTIGLFHLIIVVDQRNRSNSMMKPSQRLDALYREVVFKATAALFDAQVKENWVATQATKLIAMRDTCIDDRTPWQSFLQLALDTNPLAQAVKSIFDSLSTYPFSTTIKIASLPLYIQLPLRPATNDSGQWSYWENHSPLGDEEEEEDLTSSTGEWNPTRLAPWKTILLLDSVDTAAGRRSINYSRRGSGVVGTEIDEAGSVAGNGGGSGYSKSRTTSATYTMGRRSRETSGAGQVLGMTGSASNGVFSTTPTIETPGSLTPVLNGSSREGTLDVGEDPDEDLSEDEKSPVFKMFKEALRPNMSLAEIAHLPAFVDVGVDLKKELYPMARLLVWKRKARVIDVVKPASKNVYFPGTSEGKDMPQLIEEFNLAFPSLAPFYKFFSRLSASPIPYSHLKTYNGSADKRLHYEALLWLLRKDLVVGAPTRVRVVASREVKVLARRMERERIERLRAEEGEGGESEIELGGGQGLFGDRDVDEEEEEDELIPNPASSRGVERAWINAICHGQPEAEVVGFQKIVRYFDGKITLQEMQYKEGMTRREVNHVLKRFEKHLITTNHT